MSTLRDTTVVRTTSPAEATPRRRRARLAGYAAVAILAVVTGFHIYWALGGEWAAAVAYGSPDLPPRAAVWVVVFLLALAILVLLGRIGVWGQRLPAWIFGFGTWALVAVFALIGLQNVASGLSSDTYGRHWHLFLFAPLLLGLAALCAIVARSAPEE